MDPKNTKLLFVKIESPERTLFAGSAQAITSYNKQGVFDILGYHENFITLIKNAVIIHFENKQKQTIPVEIGIMKVYENNVSILIGIKTIPGK